MLEGQGSGTRSSDWHMIIRGEMLHVDTFTTHQWHYGTREGSRIFLQLRKDGSDGIRLMPVEPKSVTWKHDWSQ
jgi:hypothetical protein